MQKMRFILLLIKISYILSISLTNYNILPFAIHYEFLVQILLKFSTQKCGIICFSKNIVQPIFPLIIIKRNLSPNVIKLKIAVYKFISIIFVDLTSISYQYKLLSYYWFLYLIICEWNLEFYLTFGIAFITTCWDLLTLTFSPNKSLPKISSLLLQR